MLMFLSDAPFAKHFVYEKRSVAEQNDPPEHDVNVESEKPPVEQEPLLHIPVVNVGH